ncbi:unnamed protein product, partial [Mesorhabditis spiculigera]
MLAYVIVASIEDSSEIENISDFLGGFVVLLNKKLRRIGSMTFIQEEPVGYFHAEIGDALQVSKIYEEVKKNNRAQMIFHILPHVDSLEYRWMKQLARDSGMIAQGILHESTVNWFAQVGGLAFAVTKITKSVCDQTANVFGQRKLNEPSAGPAIEDPSRKDVDEITDGSRHQQSGEITLVVEGISPHVKPAKLFAVLLSPIRVLQVKWHYTVVHVTFVNNHEALQACEKFRRVMSDKYPLVIRSLNDVEREGIN